MARKDVNQELEKMQTALKESEQRKEKKGSKVGNILRQALIYLAIAGILAVVVMAYLSKR